MKMLEDRIVQTAWIKRRVFSMPSGWALVKFENCFHTGGGGDGDDGLAALVVVVTVFCDDAILVRLNVVSDITCNFLFLARDWQDFEWSYYAKVWREKNWNWYSEMRWQIMICLSTGSTEPCLNRCLVCLLMANHDTAFFELDIQIHVWYESLPFSGQWG